MSAKRSRPGDSSNFIQKDLLNHVSLPVKYAREVCCASSPSDVGKPPKCLKTLPDESNKEQLWNETVLMSTAHDSIFGGIGSFLKYCYYCKKEIDQRKDVFIYRDLCAFCNEDCRNYQIELAEKTEGQSAESGGVIQEQELNNFKNSFFLKH